MTRPPRCRGLPAWLALVSLHALAAGASAQQTAPAPKSTSPGWMGIRGAPVVHVVEVVPGGPAERAGLRPGDLITAVDGRSAIEDGGLMAHLGRSRPGDTIRLELSRADETLELELVLGAFPAELLGERTKPAAPSLPKGPVPPSPPAPPSPAAYPAAAPRADLRWLGEEERPFLGVRLQHLTPGLANYFDLPPGGSGLLVEHVHEESPAASAGLRAGDVLVAIDGTVLASITQVGSLLRGRSKGDLVRLAWRRGSEDRAAEVPLAARKKDIWVVAPPVADSAATRAPASGAALEARLRALELERRRLEAEAAAIRSELETADPGR